MILALTRDKDAGGAWFRIERRGDEFLAIGSSRPISSRARARAMPSPSGRWLRRWRRVAGASDTSL